MIGRLARELFRPVGSPPEQIDGWVICGGRSMEPTVKAGQRVRVRPCGKLRAGDVVVFKSRTSETHVLHRVVLKVPGLPWFVHLGDSPEAKAGLASTSQVEGRADLPRQRPTLRNRWSGLERVVRGARNLAGRLRKGHGAA